MKWYKCLFLLALVSSVRAGAVSPADVSLKSGIRPPATPLVTVDPYFSIWSSTDALNTSLTVHWTGKPSPLLSYVRVDGTLYRVLGREEDCKIILNTIKEGPWQAKCRIDKAPEGDWTDPGYDDASWETVDGAIGSRGRREVKTYWGGNDSDVWVRRSFVLEKDLTGEDRVLLDYSHDDIFELYVNGHKVVDTGNTWRDDVILELPAEVVATLKAGKNVIAAHCHNTYGGSFVDFGLKKRVPPRFKAVVAEQTGLSVLPMRTVASFVCGPVDLDLVFTAPLFLDNLELISRPVNYVTWQARSNDGGEHKVQVYFTASPKQAVDFPAQAIYVEKGSADGVDFVRAGTQEQNILGRKGDNVRIDWGYVYVGTPAGKGQVAVSDYYRSLERFAKRGGLFPGKRSFTREGTDKDLLALSYANDLGKVGPEVKADYVMLAYDDIYSIQFFGTDLRPYWNRSGNETLSGQLALAAAEYDALMKDCADFDARLMADAVRTGGREYAELCALAYRQAITAHKLVESPEAGLLFLSKENFSNGSIGTVDVTYPSEPLFLYYNPELAKCLLNQIFYYSESGRWTKPFAAHDVGTYPLANGQTYRGDMPVEESGNMLILTAAIAQLEGNADYAARHWATLTTWTDYLLEHGLDPEDQLCTDDFAGHFAHNANLSVKAIMGIASFARLAEMLGKKDVAARYGTEARKMASAWKEMAADGDHYKLTFDKAGTWSQKYNLVWDKLFGTKLFDPEIARTEIAYYKTRQNVYGLPLDNRKTYTKTDWIMWTAALSESKEDFEVFIRPVYKYMNETDDRVPMSDFVYTDSKRHQGFQARSVVGGYFIRLLADKMADAAKVAGNVEGQSKQK